MKTVRFFIVAFALLVFSQCKTSSSVSSHASTTQKNGNDLIIKVKGVSFTMKLVEGGTFQMGTDDPYNSDDCPAHSVTLSTFYMGETEVTQALWKAVMGNNPSYFKGDNLPVENVNWNDCQEFVRKLNQLTNKNFRLPTEAEWEYAARGGKKSQGYKYAGSNSLGSVAWYEDHSGDKTHPVKGKSPNELGIYDMSGNVYEWCSDWYDYNYYKKSPSNNPQGPSKGSGSDPRHVTRGGGFFMGGYNLYLRTTWDTNKRDNEHGLRLALSR